MNLAAHAMYSDPPETFNPLGLDWEQVPEIRAMHAAFFTVLAAARRYDFRRDLEVAAQVLQDQLHGCFLRANQHLEWSRVAQEIQAAEHEAVMLRLEELARGLPSRDAGQPMVGRCGERDAGREL
jgi:hypothetical protein